MARPAKLAGLAAFASALVACEGRIGGVGTEVAATDDAGASVGAIFSSFAPRVLPKPPADVTNRYADDPAAAALGERFFADPSFSGALLDGDNDGSPATLGKKGETGKVACSGCHIAEAGFVDDRSPSRQISLAAGWVTRKTRSLFDVGHATLLMWDGRFDTLHRQAIGPLESPLELNSSRLFLAQRIFASYRDDYEAVFGPMPPLDDTARFPPLDAATTGCAELVTLRDCATAQHGAPGDGAEYDHLSAEDQEAVTRVAIHFGKSLGAHLRTLSCGPGRFDAWVHGDASALDDVEQLGARLFVGKAGCAACHSGPFFTDNQFHNVALPPAVVAAAISYPGTDPGAVDGIAAAIEDPLNSKSEFSDGYDGRLPEALGEHLVGAFRTPSLRCAARHPSFMHSGQILSLEAAVAFIVDGGGAHAVVGRNDLAPVPLSDDERAALVAFLRALDPALPPP
jgi:cytochrome c peroxidase